MDDKYYDHHHHHHTNTHHDRHTTTNDSHHFDTSAFDKNLHFLDCNIFNLREFVAVSVTTAQIARKES